MRWPAPLTWLSALACLFLRLDFCGADAPRCVSSYASAAELAKLIHAGDQFGSSVVDVGDLDGDGVSELAVGAPGDDHGDKGKSYAGSVHILFYDQAGKLRNATRLAIKDGKHNDRFGASLSQMGDVDGDGVSDLVVGAPGLDSGRVDAGGFYVVYLKRDGSLKLARPVDAKTFPALRLQAGDAFGSSLANAGDVDGDGTDDVAVSARQCDHGAIAQRVETGCAYVCFMISEKGEPRGCTRLAGPGMPKLAAHDFFGDSLAAVGDLDGDGIRELAVGATGDADSGAGAVYVLFLTKDAAVSKHAKISKAHEPWLPVSKGDHFGSALAYSASGVLAVGAENARGVGGAAGYGAVVLVSGLGPDGPPDKALDPTYSRIDGLGPLAGALHANDRFGHALAFDARSSERAGRDVLIVGAKFDDVGGANSGGLWSLHLATDAADCLAEPSWRTAAAAVVHRPFRSASSRVALSLSSFFVVGLVALTLVFFKRNRPPAAAALFRPKTTTAPLRDTDSTSCGLDQGLDEDEEKDAGNVEMKDRFLV